MTRPGMNKKGSALVLVLIFMVVLTVLGTAVMGIAVTENKTSIYQENKMQAYYLARSGAQSVAEYMIANPNNDADKMLNKVSDLVSPMDDGTFQVDVVDDPSSKTVHVVSTGTYRGVKQDVNLLVTYTTENVGGIFEYAIVAKVGISVDNKSGSGIVIDGSIRSQTGTITLGKHGKVINGDIKVDPTLQFPEIEEPDIYDFSYGIINSTKTFNTVEGSPLYVHANGIDLKKQGNTNPSIIVNGNGVLHIYVDGDVTIGTQASAAQVSQNAKVYIYVIGQRTVSWRGSGRLSNVFIYAPDSAIEWNNAQPNNGDPSEDYNLFGSLIGKTVKLHNQIFIKYNDQLANDVNLGASGIGVDFTGYRWID